MNMFSHMPFPWLAKQKKQIVDAKLQNRLGHAYLFSGLAGLGKEWLAKELSQWMLCLAPGADKACGQCQSCHLYQAQTHPDFYLLTLEEESSQIKVDQIRELSEFCTQTTQIAPYQIVMILQADKMNIAAANALLKTLEEPNSRTIIFLVSNQWSRLPMTVKSRCQKILFYAPNQQDGLEWLVHNGMELDQAKVLLNIAGGAPLAAKKLFDADFLTLRKKWFSEWINWQIGKMSSSQVIKSWAASSVPELLSQMQTWYADIFKIQQGLTLDKVTNIDVVDTLNKLVNRVYKKPVFNFYRQVEKVQLDLLANPNLNSELVLADLLNLISVK